MASITGVVVALVLCGGLIVVVVRAKHRNKYRNIATLVEMRRTDYMRKLAKIAMQDSYSTTTSDYYNYITSKYKKANKYLQKIEKDWYIKDYACGELRKIVAKGVADDCGHHTVITENGKAHYIFKPQEKFMAYLQTLPVQHDQNKLHFNGTDYLVRLPNDTSWRQIAFHGLGGKQDLALHLIDNQGTWHRIANESKVFNYISRLPKTVARADNHRLKLGKDGSWTVKTRGVQKDLINRGDFVVHVFSDDNHQWFSLKNPPMKVKEYIVRLPMDIWDPYDLAHSESQTQLPGYKPYRLQRELFQTIA